MPYMDLRTCTAKNRHFKIILKFACKKKNKKKI